jgi:hypothetical protein
LKILNHLYRTLGHFLKQVWLLPQTLMNFSKQKQARTALDNREVERLDRIRNPDKYRGKEI